VKKVLLVLVMLTFVVIGLGFYRGWFALSSTDAGDESNKVNVNLTVDSDKMKEDATAVKKKTADLTDSVTSGGKNANDGATDNLKSTGPERK